jgi:MinD-like ATPase involved in chromosome partitioning or flagellar assembly
MSASKKPKTTQETPQTPADPPPRPAPAEAPGPEESLWNRPRRPPRLVEEQAPPPVTGRPPEDAGDFMPERMLSTGKAVPSRGWRRLVYRLTLHRLNPGLSRDERRERELIASAKRPIHHFHQVAVLTLKGGEGKTTTATMLGHTFASVREDRVVALDATPDVGTLADRVRRDTAADVRDLVREADRIDTYADMRAFTSRAPSRLEVLACEGDMQRLSPFGGEEYQRVIQLVGRWYSLLLTDCGPGVSHDAMGPILRQVDQIVVPASPSIDGGRSASLTLDWLRAHGHGELARGAVIVLNSARRDLPIDAGKVARHFERRVRAVVRVPWDPHLAAGTVTSLEALQPATRRAYLELAAVVADRFGSGDG